MGKVKRVKKYAQTKRLLAPKDSRYVSRVVRVDGWRCASRESLIVLNVLLELASRRRSLRSPRSPKRSSTTCML